MPTTVYRNSELATTILVASRYTAVKKTYHEKSSYRRSLSLRITMQLSSLNGSCATEVEGWMKPVNKAGNFFWKS